MTIAVIRMRSCTWRQGWRSADIPGISTEISIEISTDINILKVVNRCEAESRRRCVCQAGAGSLDDFATSIAELRSAPEEPHGTDAVHDCSCFNMFT